MPVGTDILPVIDTIRGIADNLIGLRPCTVTARVITWTGGRVGMGTRSVVDTPLKVGAGTGNPAVKQVSTQEAIASGGLFTNQDMRVGPLTPAYTGGGVNYTDITPNIGTHSTEVYVKITGPGIPSGGAWYEVISRETDSPLHIFFVVRRAAVQNP